MDALEKSGARACGEIAGSSFANRLAVVVAAEGSGVARVREELVKLPRIAARGSEKSCRPASTRRSGSSRSGLWAQAEPKVVPTLDVRAALAAVETEAAAAAVVYTTDAAISKKVRVAFIVRNAARNHVLARSRRGLEELPGGAVRGLPGEPGGTRDLREAGLSHPRWRLAYPSGAGRRAHPLSTPRRPRRYLR
jgi:molybdate transport system substrate-binding protein